jgi:hypothetical protein
MVRMGSHWPALGASVSYKPTPPAGAEGADRVEGSEGFLWMSRKRAHRASTGWCEDLLYQVKAGPAGGRLGGRPRPADHRMHRRATVPATGIDLAVCTVLMGSPQWDGYEPFRHERDMHGHAKIPRAAVVTIAVAVLVVAGRLIASTLDAPGNKGTTKAAGTPTSSAARTTLIVTRAAQAGGSPMSIPSIGSR